MSGTLVCREAARWMFSSLDEPPTEAAQRVLDEHFEICLACRRIRDQVEIIRIALVRWRIASMEAEPGIPAPRNESGGMA